MFSSNYERVQTHDEDDHVAGSHSRSQSIPTSPPPSFRSRASSRRNSAQQDPHRDEEADHDIDDAFAAPSDDESDEDAVDADRRRLVPSNEQTPARTSTLGVPAPPMNRQVTEINMFLPGGSRSVPVGGGSSSAANDGVFANLSAKPIRGEDAEEKPPTYEQAAADSPPPFWETTILAPGSFNSDDIFVDGLLVGSLFSFVWNALISMSFQLIGFLLTYLLHTTHAAKHGSRAGLGITLIQYGFTFRASPSDPITGQPTGDPAGGIPSDPNAHDFNPNDVTGGIPGSDDASAGLGASDWIAYSLMIVGWFILIRAVSDFIRARRQEQIVRGTPDRGLGVAVVGSNETPAQAV